MASTSLTDSARPENRCAAWFMQRKGLAGLEPVDVRQLDDQDCWYFIYELPNEGGLLELEVSWTPRRGWHTMVTTYQS